MNFNRLISLLLLIAFYSPAWDLGTIWAPFTAKAPPTQAIKETPRTRKNVVFMRVSGVFQSLNRPEIILCKRELFYYFLLSLFEKEKCAASEGVNEGFRHLLDYINQHYTESLSLSTLATEYYLNFSYASSLFKKTTGQTFSEYLTELRMKRAKDLLADPAMSISEVGTQCGYEDSYYFSKVFKKWYGVTPSAYRAAR